MLENVLWQAVASCVSCAPGVRHSQFARSTGGSILWRAGVSQGGAKLLSCFTLQTLWRWKHLRFCFYLFLSCSAVWEHWAKSKEL